MLVESVAREVRWWALTRVDPEGWSANGFSEFLGPFLTAYRNLYGQNGLRHRSRTRRRRGSRRRFSGTQVNGVHLLETMLFLGTDDDRSAVRWYLDRYPQFRRPANTSSASSTWMSSRTEAPQGPVSAFEALCTRRCRRPCPRSGAGGRPEEARPSRKEEEKRQEDRQDLREGQRLPHGGGEFLTPRENSVSPRPDADRNLGWIMHAGNAHLNAPEYSSYPAVRGFYNESRATVLHEAFEADGSGSLTLHCDATTPA